MRQHGGQNRDQGAITVFLAITFLFVMAFLGTLIDGARVAEAHAQVYHAADLAATSALAGFDEKLKNHYGLFAYREDPQDVYRQVAENNLKTALGGERSESEELYELLRGLVVDDVLSSGAFDLLLFQDIEAEPTGTPDHLLNANEFERQVFEYVKFRGPIELFTNNLFMDFEDIKEELDLAANEETVDEELLKLEKEAAQLLEKQNVYNDKAKALREEIERIETERLELIKEKLEEDPSQTGLDILGGWMERLQVNLPNTARCDELEDLLGELERDAKRLQQNVARIRGNFSGGGDSAMYNGLKISGEMLDIYQKDLDRLEKDGDLSFPGGTLDAERGKIRDIRSGVQTSYALLPNLMETAWEVANLEEPSKPSTGGGGWDEWGDWEDWSDWEDEEDDSSLDELVREVWDDIADHFDSGIYWGGSGFVTSGKALQTFERESDPNARDDIEYKEYMDKAGDEDEAESSKRKYTVSIPADYTLPSSMGSPDSGSDSTISLDSGDWKDKSMDDAWAVQEKNKQSHKDITSYFSIGDFALTTLDNAMLGLYALGNFENTLCWNVDNRVQGYDESCDQYITNMRGLTIQSHFTDCEVEYLLKGNLEEQKNYSALRGELRAIYAALNFARVRKADNVSTTVEGIARGVEIAIPSLSIGRIAYYAVREGLYIALAAAQTTKDLEKLYLGEKAALWKSDDDHFDGVPSVFTWTNSGGGGRFEIGYVDYLFLRLILSDHDTLVSRLQNLVQLNMDKVISPGFQLAECRTTSMVKVSAKVPYLFINVMFLAESSDATGMTVTKRVSQKY